jgi:hypothetical protein
MRKLFILSFIVTLFATASHATVRRIGYWGTPVSGVDYTTFALAQTASSNGDTIYFFPTSSAYGGINVTKQLVIIGGGYLLDASLTTTSKGNNNLQYFKNETAIGSVSFETGSSGSKVFGIIGQFYIGNLLTSVVSNIEINRCQASLIYIYSSSANDIRVYNCILYSSYIQNAFATSSVTNLRVYNCLDINMNSTMISWSSTGALTGEFVNNSGGNLNIGISGSLVVNNNIFTQLQTTNNANCVFNNNLIRGLAASYTLAGAGNVYNNFSNSNPGTPVNNTVMQGWPFQSTFSADERFRLAAASPAIGIGLGGVDAGMTGGPLPYKLSGIPPIPSIYSLSSPQGNNPSGSTITINLSTRGNN